MASDKVCVICKFGETDELDNGEWKTIDGAPIHLFCALLSTNLLQKGEDGDGVDGFSLKDIRALTKLHTETKCVYCKMLSASVRCRKLGCARYFHVSCGAKNGCLSIFNDKFKSYCDKHIEITEKYECHDWFWKCQICFDRMGVYNPITSIPSCCNQGYFHKKCMQMHGKVAGNETKCPCCGNSKDEDGLKYRHFIQQRGIYCPDRKAEWEMVGAFADIEKWNYNCVAAPCRCPEGSKYRGKGVWDVLCCEFCGDNCLHFGCRDPNTNDSSFVCEICDLNTNNTPNNAIKNDKIEKKTLNLVKTDKLPFRDSVLVWENPRKKQHLDPLSIEKRGKLREKRLNMFWERIKPSTFP